MQTWSITLHGPAGVISTVDTGESQFVVGTEIDSRPYRVRELPKWGEKYFRY
jgi:hypothetical protein